jgi:hypothetical protein
MNITKKITYSVYYEGTSNKIDTITLLRLKNGNVFYSAESYRSAGNFFSIPVKALNNTHEGRTYIKN